MSSRWQALRRHIAREGQSGQSVVILAFGFVVLLGFVGIVTDVSLLLVRYSTLTRAVDAAAIAAAGQMRQDRSFGEVSIAARQMIEFYGISPTDVIVDVCDTTYTRDADGNPIDDGDEFLCAPRNLNRKLVRVGARIESETVFLRVLGFESVEVSAIAISETATLDVVIIMNVSESMLQDTTYRDWARIGLGQVYVPPKYLDIMGAEIAAGRFTNNLNPTYQVTNDPQDRIPDILQFWKDLLSTQMEVVNRRLDYGPGVPNPFAGSANPNYPVQSFPFPGFGAQQHPRPECRVRFWPYSTSALIPDHFFGMAQWRNSWNMGTATDPNTWEGFVPTLDFYGCCNDPTWGGQVDGDYNLTVIPGYDSVDITRGDFDFSDLICQPFKQARDATLDFLQRVDFERGDRVAFVTYDRTAFLIDPDGFNGSTVDHYCGDVDPNTGRTGLTHMIETRNCAEQVLRRNIGVRAEPNFYRWRNDGGGWVGFSNGINADGSSRPIDYYTTDPNLDLNGDGFSNAAANDYPVRGNCPFQNAALPGYFSLYSLWDWNIEGLLKDPPDPFTYDAAADQVTGAGLYRIMTPNPRDPAWAGNGLTVLQSYELQASCRGANVGAALREANNSLLDPQTTRREGTVWVMVLLGDGAAGASDPVRRNGFKPNEARPYYDREARGEPWLDWGGYNNIIRYGLGAAEQSPGIAYGWFGLCPIGTPSRPGQLTRTDRLAEFPFCSDELPETRHFCTPPNNDRRQVGQRCGGLPSGYQHGFAPGSFDRDYDCDVAFEINLSRGNVYDVDIGAPGSESDDTCSLYYDVDDYARDWADYVSLSRGGGDEQLPTIFTIGFGLNFTNGSPTPNLDPSDPNYIPGPASMNIPDYLGEELLRYIADVGENFEVNTHYQQDWLDDRQLTGTLSGGRRFGPRGSCEDPNVAPDLGPGSYSSVALMIAPLPPRTDCGNYYNAPDQARLQIVFDDIASRMFTRLAP